MSNVYRPPARICLLPLLFILFSFGGPVCALETGDPAPAFSLPRLGGDTPLALADLRGKLVYVDFWASWCGPCRKSLPLYEEMQASFPANRFRIIAINLDEDREDVLHFLASRPVSYPILLDPEGVTASQWQIRVMPSSFLLDTDGAIVKAWVGFELSHIEEIKNEVRSLLR
ncbi:MAG: TlpA disulfide reductase family protein [Xanthomonadales bacterium]